MAPVRLDQVDWAKVTTAIRPPMGRFVAEVADTLRWTRFTRRSGTNVYTLHVPSELVENVRESESVKNVGRRVTARIEYPDTEKGRRMGESLTKRVAMALGIDPSDLIPTTVTDEEDPYNGGLIEGHEGRRFQLTIDEVDDSYNNQAGEHIERTAIRFYFDPVRDEA